MTHVSLNSRQAKDKTDPREGVYTIDCNAVMEYMWDNQRD